MKAARAKKPKAPAFPVIGPAPGSKSAQAYADEMKAAGLASLVINFDTPEQAFVAAARLRAFEKSLKLFKRAAQGEMRAIRARARIERHNVGGGPGALLGIFDRGWARQRMANARRDHAIQTTNRIAPYEHLVLAIERILAQVEGLKHQADAMARS